MKSKWVVGYINPDSNQVGTSEHGTHKQAFKEYETLSTKLKCVYEVRGDIFGAINSSFGRDDRAQRLKVERYISAKYNSKRVVL